MFLVFDVSSLRRFLFAIFDFLHVLPRYDENYQMPTTPNPKPEQPVDRSGGSQLKLGLGVGLPADWSEADRENYAYNVQEWLSLGRGEVEAHQLAFGMVDRARRPSWEPGSLF